MKQYQRGFYDQPNIELELKVRMVDAKAVEALLYGCGVTTTRQGHDNKFRTVHRILLRILGATGQESDHCIISYNAALEPTGCESV